MACRARPSPIWLPSPMLSSICRLPRARSAGTPPRAEPRLYRAGRGTSGSTARRRNTAGSEGAVHNWSVRYVRDAVLHRAGSVSKLAPNLWPVRPVALRPALQAYWHELDRVAQSLCRIFAEALDLAPDFFYDKVD